MNADKPNSHFPLGEDDAVMRLLGRAPLLKPDAWFAARTVARCRSEEISAAPASRSISLTLVWRWILGGGLAFSMTMALVVTQVHTQTVSKQKHVQEAFEIISTLDPDADNSSTPSTSTWQDSSY